MTYTFKLARRLAISQNFVVLTILVFLAACMRDLTAPEAGSTGSFDHPASLQVIPRRVTIETRQPVQFRGQALTLRATIPTCRLGGGGTISADGMFIVHHLASRSLAGSGLKLTNLDHGVNPPSNWLASRRLALLR
jgi:hypothetical protein